MAATKYTVSYTEVTMQPYAKCTYWSCNWKLDYSKDTTAAACRAHVAETGHKVRRIKETVAVYYPDTPQ
jgi:hypothetical protein